MIYYEIYIVLQLLLRPYGVESINSSPWENLPEDCGLTKHASQTRIIDGDMAELGQFPWIVRLGKARSNGRPRFFCGGSLISRYYVVSAAHCKKDVNLVRVGENNLVTKIDCDRRNTCAPPHQDIMVKKFKTLDFRANTQINDLGLLELEKPAELNDFVQPVCLPPNPIPHENINGRYVVVAGWGVIDNESLLTSKDLMYISVPIVNASECDEIYPHPLKDSQFCIGYPEGGKDSCGGDSGGPVIMSVKVDGERRAYLIAVVSYGLTMCGHSAAVYTDVSYFIEWILKNIEKK